MTKIFKISKKDSLKLFERIIFCIKKQKKGFFSLKKLKGVHGYCNWEDGIQIDYRKDFIATIIHECIHLLEPDWPENQVLYAESRVLNSVSEDDICRLLIFFLRKL